MYLSHVLLSVHFYYSILNDKFGKYQQQFVNCCIKSLGI